jgi:hypothetical protein
LEDFGPFGIDLLTFTVLGSDEASKLSNDLRKLFAFDLTKFKLSVEGARIGGAI